MPAVDRSPWTHQLTWRIAAQWLVLLALGLGAIGIVVALLQTRSLAVRLMAPAEAQARHIAETVLKLFEKEASTALRAVENHWKHHQHDPWKPPGTFPAWMDGLFVWDEDRFKVLSPPSDDRSRLLVLVEERLAAKMQYPPQEPRREVEMVYDSIENAPVALACMESTGTGGGRRLIAGLVNLDRLKADLVEPLLFSDSGLEIVPVRADTRHLPWSQRLYGPMRYWQIKPTEAFIRRQEKAVLGQTLVYLALTGLALATLMVAVWVLGRVAKRELVLTEMKSNFVADVSHELKTPLALIRMFGETLQSGRVPSEEKRREYYEIITRESTRLTNLINNILDFARIEAGRKEYTLERTNIAKVVRETYEAYRAQLEYNGFEHHLSVADSLPEVDADADAVAQALINLINNAIKYCGEERYLAIDVTDDTRRGRRGVLISVHDRGIGIRPEDRAHLFDGFFRAGDARVRHQGGAGLGLALVKHIVDAHQGSLDVESRLVKGSTFRIFLPASERQGTAPGERPTKNAS